MEFPKATTTEANGEISCSIEETNRIRAELGLKPLRLDGKGKADEKVQGGSVSADVVESNGEVSCSVEETNRVRALLGLKPLRVDDGKGKSKRAVDVSGVAGDKAKGEDISRRIALAKKRRKLNSKLQGKTLGDETENDEGGVAAWLARNEKRQKEKLVERPTEKSGKRRTYSSKDLDGLKVSHELDQLDSMDGEPVILTLKDSQLIDEDTGELAQDEDELENTRIASIERHAERRAALTKRKRKANLDGVDGEEKSGILSHYDKVIEEEGLGGKRPKATAKMVLGGSRTMSNQANLVQEKQRKSHTEMTSPDALVSGNRAQEMQDYYTNSEFEALELPIQKKKKKKKEKKEKKRKKSKKKQDAENSEDEGNVIVRRGKSRKQARDEFEDGDDDISDLHAHLSSARKAALSRKEPSNLDSIANAVREPLNFPREKLYTEEGDESLVISSTSRFSSVIQARNDQESERRTEKITTTHAPLENVKTAVPVQVGNNDKPVDEPVAPASGLAETLKLIQGRGDCKASNSSIVVGRARDERPAEDNSGGFVLEYRDEQGRLLTTKEAFRQMAYKFHGHGPSFKKKEKRRKELEFQNRLLQDKNKAKGGSMLDALQKRQQSSGSAHVVLR
uniref:SART-1 family protein n=1 Tax=Mucochytrium quahogii TaxID=96639 RepID=A0A7S2RWK0_9STRA|mmetsp:Transcript_21201/g.46123  ORF Transcript_21201/g.46123 Transcript_21201/m.46123 type:complete len:624 (+) Transcript_21201:209-2080(+)